MEDKVSALLYGDTGEIDQRITQSLIDGSNAVAKLARSGERQSALVIRAIDLLPGRRDEHLRVVPIDPGRILTGWKVEAKECSVAQDIRYSPIEENRSLWAITLPVGIEHSGEHQFDKQARVFLRKAVPLDASLFGEYGTCRFHDSPDTP